MTPPHCTATTAAGHPCRAHPVRGTDPPLCSAHLGRNTGAGAPPGNQNRRTHGFYSQTLTMQELSDLLDQDDLTQLDGEIACARVLLRRLMQATQHPGASPEDQARVTALALQAARTIARLLRDKRALDGEAADGIAGAIGQILDELGTEWGVEL